MAKRISKKSHKAMKYFIIWTVLLAIPILVSCEPDKKAVTDLVWKVEMKAKIQASLSEDLEQAKDICQKNCDDEIERNTTGITGDIIGDLYLSLNGPETERQKADELKSKYDKLNDILINMSDSIIDSWQFKNAAKININNIFIAAAKNGSDTNALLNSYISEHLTERPDLSDYRRIKSKRWTIQDLNNSMQFLVKENDDGSISVQSL